jgi:hypothetical protein
LEEAGMFRDDMLNSPEAASAEKKRKCPICHRKMKKVNVGEPPVVLIDTCRQEHGVWFDGGEVIQLVRHLAGEHLAEGGPRELVIKFIEEVFGAPEKG